MRENELVQRLDELETREAEVERGLAKLLERQRRFPSEATDEQVAGLRRDHLETRRALNTLRAQLLPIHSAAR